MAVAGTGTPPILGWRRPDGSVGIRNHLLVIACAPAANPVALRIQKLVPEAVVITHQHGESQAGDDARLTFATLAGAGRNPNAGAVLVVGAGSPVVDAEALKPLQRLSGRVLVAVAAWFGKARLIDNVVLEVSETGAGADGGPDGTVNP